MSDDEYERVKRMLILERDPQLVVDGERLTHREHEVAVKEREVTVKEREAAIKTRDAINHILTSLPNILTEFARQLARAE